MDLIRVIAFPIKHFEFSMSYPFELNGKEMLNYSKYEVVSHIVTMIKSERLVMCENCFLSQCPCPYRGICDIDLQNSPPQVTIPRVTPQITTPQVTISPFNNFRHFLGLGWGLVSSNSIR